MLLPFCFSLCPGWWLFVFKFCWLLLFVAATQEIASERGWLHRMFGSCLKERTGNVCFMKNLAIHQDLRPEVWEHDCNYFERSLFGSWKKKGWQRAEQMWKKCMESPHYMPSSWVHALFSMFRTLMLGENDYMELHDIHCTRTWNCNDDDKNVLWYHAMSLFSNVAQQPVYDIQCMALKTWKTIG